jgi:hypothetical protein
MMEEKAPRDFEIRQVVSGGFSGGAGYALEILDGGLKGGENKLLLGRGSLGTDPAITASDFLRATPGNRLVSYFDYVYMPPGADANDVDTVTFRVQKVRQAVATDTVSPGLTRKRYLARGLGGVIAAGQAEKMYESNPISGPFGLIRRDDYYTDSRLTDLGYFDGWVAGDTTFTVWIFAARSNSTAGAGTFRPIAAATAQNRSAMAAVFGANHTAAYSYNFTWGSTGLTSTVNVPVPVPGTAFEIWVENNGAGNLNYEYAIGIRGSL